MSFEEDLQRTFNQTSSSTMEPTDQGEDAAYVIPMRVIIPAEHVHRDSENPYGRFKKYQYYVLKSDDASFHGHLPDDQPEIVAVWRDLDAGLVPVEEEQEQVTSTTENAVVDTSTSSVSSTSPSSGTSTNSLDSQEVVEDDQPIFGFPSSSEITFGSGTTDLLSTATEQIVVSTTPIPEPSSTDPLGRKDPLVYVNYSSKDKFKVRKKYRFGGNSNSVDYNPGNFDEVEFLRVEPKTFIQPSKAGDNDAQDSKSVPRQVNDHYSNIIPWLDFMI